MRLARQDQPWGRHHSALRLVKRTVNEIWKLEQADVRWRSRVCNWDLKQQWAYSNRLWPERCHSKPFFHVNDTRLHRPHLQLSKGEREPIASCPSQETISYDNWAEQTKLCPSSATQQVHRLWKQSSRAWGRPLWLPDCTSDDQSEQARTRAFLGCGGGFSHDQHRRTSKRS